MTRTTIRGTAAVFAIAGLLLFAVAGASWGETPASGGSETPAAGAAKTPAAGGCPAPDDPKDPCDRDHMMGKTDTLKQLQAKLNNPLSSLWSLQLEQNFNWNDGSPSNKYRNSYKTIFQPAMPVPLTKNITWISRPVFSFVSTPKFDARDGDWGRTAGLSSLTYETWFTPTKAHKVQLALGGAFSFPLGGNDELNSGKYSIGPSAVMIYKHKDWIFGGLANWLFSVGGSPKRGNVNEASFQYFITWAGLPDHWQLNSSPTITYNKRADGSDAWAVPIGAGVGKMIKIGKLPMKVQIEYDYYVAHHDSFGPRHLFSLKLTPVIPALIKKPLF